MLELAFMGLCIMLIIGVGVLSLDHLKRWFMGLANDLIELSEKREMSQIRVEKARLELDQKFNTYNH
jgi:hypothetical protein